MTVLPSPIPYPLDSCPWDLPGWAYEALERVVGRNWPEGDEQRTWDLADQWYAVAVALAGPRDEAFHAAREIVAGYGGTGLTVEAFTDAWNRLAVADGAPLLALPAGAEHLGGACERAGREIEAAKLEAWIELGHFVNELVALAATGALTLGAASPAVGGAITATRMVIQRIFQRLATRLGEMTLTETLDGISDGDIQRHTAQTGPGQRGGEMPDQRPVGTGAGEERVIDLGIQIVPIPASRRDGADAAEPGMSTWDAFGGGTPGQVGPGGDVPVGPGMDGPGTADMSEIGGPAAVESLSGDPTAGESGPGDSMAGRGHQETSDGLMDDPPLFAAGLPGAPIMLATASLDGMDSLSATPSAGPSAPPAPGNSSPPGVASAHPSAGLVASGAVSPASVPSPVPPAPSRPAGGQDQTTGGARFGPVSAPGPVSALGPEVHLAGVVPAGQAGGSAVNGGPMGAGTVHGGPMNGGAASVGLGGGPLNGGPLNGGPASGGPVGGGPMNVGSVAPAAGSPPAAAVPASGGTANGATTGGVTAAPVAATPVAASPVSAAPVAAGPVQAGGGVSHGGGVQHGGVSVGSPAPATGSSPSASPGQPEPGQPESGQPESGQRESGPVESGPAEQGQDAPTPPALVVIPVTGPGPAPAGTARQPARRQRPDDPGQHEHTARQRALHERSRREDQAAHLRATARNLRQRADDLAKLADHARHSGQVARADHLAAQVDDALRASHERDQQAQAILDGMPPVQGLDQMDGEITGGPDDRIHALAPGGVRTGAESALTGPDGSPPVERTRRYERRGGFRPPRAVDQVDLENAMPRDSSGRVVRIADPRVGEYFGLANDGGPLADPTRAINCQDCVLSFFDTWVHGRPRVSAPRTFDAYADGDPVRPLDGEAAGPGRVEDVTGGRFQGLCPYVGHLPPEQAQQAVNHAMNNLHTQLRNGGRGSFGFVITAWEGGSSHVWAAINQGDAILYVDPQNGRISENLPLYGHYGQEYAGNVVMMDALVIGPDGGPMPLPNHPTGAWSTRPPLPGTTPSASDEAPQERISPEAVPATDADPESESRDEPVAETDAEPDLGTEPVAEPGGEPGPEVESEAQPGGEPGPEPMPEPDLDGPRDVSRPERDVEPAAGADLEQEATPEPEAGTGTEPEAEPMSEAEADPVGPVAEVAAVPDEPVVDLAAEPAPEQATAVAPEPTAETAREPAVEPTPASAPESTVEPDAGPDPGPAGPGQPGGEDQAPPVVVDRILAVYEALGDSPPLIRLTENDRKHAPAHTVERHGPHITLGRAAGWRTVEGRIHGDQPWAGAENWAYTWIDEATMNRVVNELLRGNWERIRSDLALFGRSNREFALDADIGQGFVSKAAPGADPREARYSRTPYVMLRVRLVPDSQPPEVYVLTVFPSGLR